MQLLDEFHQLFVPGSSGQIKDVLIDTLGIIGGILLYKVIIRTKKQIRIVATQDEKVTMWLQIFGYFVLMIFLWTGVVALQQILKVVM